MEMCPRVLGRVPNHWPVCKGHSACLNTCTAVAVPPGCMYAWGPACARVLGRGTSSAAGLTVRTSPSLGPFWAKPVSHVSVPSFQVLSSPRAEGKMRTSRPRKGQKLSTSSTRGGFWDPTKAGSAVRDQKLFSPRPDQTQITT